MLLTEWNQIKLFYSNSLNRLKSIGFSSNGSTYGLKVFQYGFCIIELKQGRPLPIDCIIDRDGKALTYLEVIFLALYPVIYQSIFHGHRF